MLVVFFIISLNVLPASSVFLCNFAQHRVSGKVFRAIFRTVVAIFLRSVAAGILPTAGSAAAKHWHASDAAYVALMGACKELPSLLNSCSGCLL